MSDDGCPVCPTCRSNGVEALGRNYSPYPSGCLCLLGFPLALFHQGQVPNRFRCRACGHHFNKRSALAKLNLMFLILIATLYLLSVGAAILLIFLRS